MRLKLKFEIETDAKLASSEAQALDILAASARSYYRLGGLQWLAKQGRREFQHLF
jgi:hypothetical protein